MALELPLSNPLYMASPINKRRAEVQRLVMRYDDRLRLARASELAARGHLLEAESLLCPGMRIPMAVEELDLLARIHVKQGLFAQARRRWMDASKVEGHRIEFEECITVLDEWLVYRRQILIWRIRLGLIAGAIILSFWLLFRLGLYS